MTLTAIRDRMIDAVQNERRIWKAYRGNNRPGTIHYGLRDAWQSAWNDRKDATEQYVAVFGEDRTYHRERY